MLARKLEEDQGNFRYPQTGRNRVCSRRFRGGKFFQPFQISVTITAQVIKELKTLWVSRPSTGGARLLPNLLNYRGG